MEKMRIFFMFNNAKSKHCVHFAEEAFSEKRVFQFSLNNEQQQTLLGTVLTFLLEMIWIEFHYFAFYGANLLDLSTFGIVSTVVNGLISCSIRTGCTCHYIYCT
ncbi:conserved hypothetical protein [Trichinella spiralis]|uniref:hypothetical protein n=1 Tax=Trichinella spiralis TaxID=6334 RepID=UPI0001EFDC9E|nr:conserved hypothetical protein [Trichinella spiralis]